MNAVVPHVESTREAGMATRLLVCTTPGVSLPWPFDSDPSAVPAETCPPESLNQLLGQALAARACVLIESPAQALCRALADGDDAPLEEVVDGWCAAASHLLRSVMSQPGRCLCASIEEVRRAYPAWIDALGSFTGARAGEAAGAEPAHDPDPIASLDALVAEAILVDHPEATDLHEQLLACCIILAPASSVAASPWAAARALRSLRARAGAALPAGPSPELETARAEARDTLERLFVAQEDLESALTDLAALRQESAAAKVQVGEAAAVKLQLEKALKAAQDETSAQRAMHARQQAEADAQRTALVHEMAAAKLQLEVALKAAQGEASAQRAALARSQAEAEAASVTLQREADMLLEKLHDAHEELGRHFLDARALRSMPALLAHGAGPSLRATGVHEIQALDEGNHRHADYQLRDVSVRGRRCLDARVRLVEHLGNPGLVLFAESAAGRWLSAWETTGREAKAEFMLIVPVDASGQDALARMGRSDWQIVIDLAGLLLRGTSEGGSTRWAGVAQRLCRELAALPVRLRYDRLDVVRDGASVRVRFGDVGFGALEWASLDVMWTPDGASGSVELLAGPEGEYLPLARWPVVDGRPAQRWRVPVGVALAARDKREAWAGLAEVDRALLLALLDALPAVQARDASPEATRVATTARVLLREAHALSRRAAWRRLARRILRRRPSPIAL